MPILLVILNVLSNFEKYYEDKKKNLSNRFI